MDKPDLQQHSVRELLALHSAAVAELRRRGICRSANNPTGDYTEYLVAQRLALTLESNSSKGFDAVDGAGLRYQIKGRRQEVGARGTQLSALRGLAGREFDFLVAVMFGADWAVRYAVKLPYEAVAEAATFKPHVNGHILHLRPGLLTAAGAEDITSQLTDGAAPV